MASPSVPVRKPLHLFADTERGFHFFEGREIFLQSINVLLHLHDGRPEFLHRAEGSPQAWQLRLGRPLTHRPTHAPEHKHPTQQTNEHPPPYRILVDATLLCVASGAGGVPRPVTWLD